MTTSRPARLLLFLALALGVQSAYANPRVVMAEVRAMACCAHHCDEPLSLPGARSCCALTAVASGLAEAPTAPAPPVLVIAALLLPSSSPHASLRWRGETVAAHAVGVGPPAYLAHQHLLI